MPQGQVKHCLWHSQKSLSLLSIVWNCIGFIILPVSICLQIILQSQCFGLQESRAVSHGTSWHWQNLPVLMSCTQEMSSLPRGAAPQPSSPAACQSLCVLAGSVKGHVGQVTPGQKYLEVLLKCLLQSREATPPSLHLASHF